MRTADAKTGTLTVAAALEISGNVLRPTIFSKAPCEA